MVDLPYTEAIRGIRPEAGADEEGQSIVRTRSSTTAPWVWIKQRGWLRPSIDPTGTEDATAAINAAALARKGACVVLPDGIVRVNGALFLQPHSALVGAQHGHGISSQFSDYPNRGTQIQAYGTGRLITMSVDSTVDGFEIFYPAQQTNATPTIFGETIFVPADAHVCTIQNIAGVNPYTFIRIGQLTAPRAANGTRIDNIIGYPLKAGIILGRCADVVRCTNVHFKNFSSLAGSTLFSWVQNNGVAFRVDGAEQFDFANCFAYGYNKGIQFIDEDGDAFRGCYGDWTGGGFDQAVTCIALESTQMLTLRGFKMMGTSLVPANGAGVALEFADSFTPSMADHYPMVTLVGVSISGATHTRGIHFAAGSHGVCEMLGGSIQQYSAEAAKVESATAHLDLTFVYTATGATRINNPAGAAANDVNPRTL